ncbi:hypothetical protein [Pseudomonas sp. S2_A02]
MARRSRAAQKKKSRELIAAIVTGVIVVAVISWFVWAYTERDIAPDKTTLCPASGPLGHYVILVDNTDPYRLIQREVFLQKIKTLATSKIPEGYLVSIYLLGADFTQNVRPVFERCNPGLGTDKTEFNSNAQRIKKRYQSGYIDPLLTMADSLLLKESSAQSPIFEMLKLVGVGFERSNVQGPRTLIMFSDMIPNTKELMMYKGIPDFTVFNTTAYGQISRSDLKNVRVEIEMLKNKPEIQTGKLRLFWESYFDNSGATLASVRGMEG